jgi:hypothetical protein
MPAKLNLSRKGFKKFYIGFVLFLFGRAFQTASKIDDELKKEILEWPDSYSIMLKVLPEGPFISFKKKNGLIKFLGFKETDADLIIFMKNIESAFLVFSCQMGLGQMYSEHRLGLKGDVYLSMVLVRCLNIIMRYLLPKILLKKSIRRMPSFGFKRFINRLIIYVVGIPFGI